MRRSTLLLVPVALLLAGCGGEVVSATPETVVGTVSVPTTTAAAGPTLPPGTSAAGKAVFVSASCGACHTLKAAGSSGQVGPNLDEGKFDLERIQSQVINGGGGMPPFEGQLTDQQIADVAQYVYETTH